MHDNVFIGGEIKSHKDKVISKGKGDIFSWFSIQCKGTEPLLRKTLCPGGALSFAEPLSGGNSFPCVNSLSPYNDPPRQDLFLCYRWRN